MPIINSRTCSFLSYRVVQYMCLLFWSKETEVPSPRTLLKQPCPCDLSLACSEGREEEKGETGGDDETCAHAWHLWTSDSSHGTAGTTGKLNPIQTDTLSSRKRKPVTSSMHPYELENILNRTKLKQFHKIFICRVIDHARHTYICTPYKMAAKNEVGHY